MNKTLNHRQRPHKMEYAVNYDRNDGDNQNLYYSSFSYRFPSYGHVCTSVFFFCINSFVH